MNKINNINIQVLKNKENEKPNLISEMFNNAYPNIYIQSKKNSGKTNLIYNIISFCAVPKKTKIYWFSKTAENDKTSLLIFEKLEKYNINYEIVDELEYFDENGKKQKNIINKIINDVKSELEFNKEKIKKSKYLYPRYIFIFDDFSEALRNKAIEPLLKKNRHYKILSIISSQYFNDISPGARANINYLILFSDVPVKKLKDIYDTYINNMTFEQFLEIYNNVTSEKYQFLYINTDDPKDLRKNFNLAIKI
jgi:hypothetical protein